MEKSPRAHRVGWVALGTAMLWVGLSPAAPVVTASACSLPLPASDRRASEILASERPFEPTRRDLFYTFEHPDWVDVAPPEPVPGPGSTEAEIRDALESFLEQRFPCTPGRVRDGLEVFGNPVARQKLPEPTLRAALAALTGTLGEPAIDFLLYGTPVVSVHFGVFVERAVGSPGRVGGAVVAEDGTRQIVIDRWYRFAPFGVFSALLVHEALHTGADEDNAGLPEETVAMAVETLVYMEMLLTDPTLARVPDGLTRMSNQQALVRLNSGPPGTDRITLFVPGSDVNVDPLTTRRLTEFYQYYASYSAPDHDEEFAERESTGNTLLQEVLLRLAEPGETPPANAGFDQTTLQFVDRNQRALSPAELVAVACILELDVPCD